MFVNTLIPMIRSLDGNLLRDLILNIVTLEIIQVVKESCPNISLLYISIIQETYQDSIISLICNLSSLKFLNIIINDDLSSVIDSVVRNLGDNLVSVEHLDLCFFIDLSSFEYFTNNCKANLKKLVISNKYSDEYEFFLEGH